MARSLPPDDLEVGVWVTVENRSGKLTIEQFGEAIQGGDGVPLSDLQASLIPNAAPHRVIAMDFPFIALSLLSSDGSESLVLRDVRKVVFKKLDQLYVQSILDFLESNKPLSKVGK